MGKIERQISEGVTKYYWYPGQKADWIRGVLTLVGGGLLFVLIYVVTKNSLLAAVVTGTAVQAVVGAYLGRRDATGLSEFHDPSTERREAVVDGTRAVWRGTLQGLLSAGSAMLVLNMPHSGFLADWVLPFVPSIIGAIAHSGGMLWERLSQEVTTSEATAASGDAPTKELEAA
jgi:integral membrane sensor domain MASE1